MLRQHGLWERYAELYPDSVSPGDEHDIPEADQEPELLAFGGTM